VLTVKYSTVFGVHVLGIVAGKDRKLNKSEKDSEFISAAFCLKQEAFEVFIPMQQSRKRTTPHKLLEWPTVA